MLAIVERLAVAYVNSIRVYTFDAIFDSEFSKAYEIQSIPGVLMFKHGKENWRAIGWKPESETTLRDKVDETLPA